MNEHWAKKQLTEAHQALTALGVPDREMRSDARHPSGENTFSLGVAERVRLVPNVGALQSALRDIVRNGDAYSSAVAARALGWSDEKRDVERLAASR